MRYQLSKARADSKERKRLIQASIDTMEKQRLPVTSERVTDRLDVGSMTPVKVSYSLPGFATDDLPYPRMLFPKH